MSAERIEAPERPRVRFSALKLMAQSPAHYAHYVRSGRGDSSAMRRGRAVHSYVLGDEDAVICYPGRRAGREWEAFRAAHPDDEILIASELEDAAGMRDALRAHRSATGPSAMDLLTSGRRERRIRWSVLGRDCEGRPDIAGPIVLAELKSTRCAEPERFVRDARRMHYEAQLAWYWDALTALGTPPREAWVVAVESTPPYVVQTFRVSDRALDMGRRLNRMWIERLLACEAADHWPGYLDGPAPYDADEGHELVIGGARVTIGADAGADDEHGTTDDEGIF